MRKTVTCGVLILFVISFLAGCAVFNPYSDEFQCPHVDKGECTSMQNAYEKSISTEADDIDDESHLERADKCTNCVKDKKTAAGEKKEQKEDARYDYQKKLYNKISSLIKNPRSPMVAAPNVMRVLMMSYTGPGNDLYSYRFVYIFVTEPKWIYSTTQID